MMRTFLILLGIVTSVCADATTAFAQVVEPEVVTITIPNTYVDVFSGPTAWVNEARRCVSGLRERGKPIVDSQANAQYVILARLDTLQGIGAAALAGIDPASGRIVASEVVVGRSPRDLGMAVARRVARMMAAGPVRTAKALPRH